MPNNGGIRGKIKAFEYEPAKKPAKKLIIEPEKNRIEEYNGRKWLLAIDDKGTPCKIELNTENELSVAYENASDSFIGKNIVIQLKSVPNNTEGLTTNHIASFRIY